jgi:GNAT superfamily N-acetyltransferase
MKEVRPITRDEAETFLRIMCAGFDLDYARARSVFYTEPLFDLNRKWALFEHGRMLSVLTTTPLLFGHGPAIGIAGVATLKDHRSCGYARLLLERVLDFHEEPALLFARDERLYKTCGFETVDEVVRGEIASDETWENLEAVDIERAKDIYAEWSLREPRRLIRDERRWRLWTWNYRVCGGFQDGYLASEPATLREAIYTSTPNRLPVPQGTEWLGLQEMLRHLHVPLLRKTHEMLMMTRNCSWKPLLFMTDQF